MSYNIGGEGEANHQRVTALVEAVRRLYYAGTWTCDRDVDEAALWIAVRDAAGFEPGNSPKPIQSGSALIVAERKRQVSELGYESSHDDEHRKGQLVRAAEVYCEAVRKHDPHAESSSMNYLKWPWDMKFWRPAAPIRMLSKAGALIAAEIDRRLRAGETP